MIHCQIEDGILKILLNRPEKKNAFTNAMYRELTQILSKGDQNSEVKVILISGAGNAFSAGNDIADFMKSPITHEDAPPINLLKALAQLTKPLIAAVDGVAVGIGATLLFHCDLVYAQKDARFIFPFVSLGLVPEGAASLLLPRLVGHQRASEILLFGEPISADDAQTLGFVNKVISESSALPYAEQRAKKLTTLSSGSVIRTKFLLKDGALKNAVLNQIEIEGKLFIDRLHGPAAKEALTSFLEKRAPNFEGLD
ncbi:enoyl-CoA hydratase [Polynucleobacter sp. JS-Polo-80-F4]|uniref:enoyl-CoA hydratase n=1 Tax=Polynucleobacter sp. JS-Polo-80-F4 TaxID=2576918 RepID=UPI001C0DACD7|nr:enoyl-CoA hydratase [Polynucleobacter sp. JS-Polo-80-F4]MBU3617356.1 enoyl-CoA hydratase [Polynucleobacter sp. JS-Polo-80-F4]